MLKSVRLATALLALSTGFALAESHAMENPMVGGAAMFDDKSRIGMFVSSGNTFAATSAVFEAVAIEK